MAQEQHINQERQRWRKALSNHLNLGDFRIICFDMNIDFDNLSGEVLDTKIISLIEELERKNRLTELQDYIFNDKDFTHVKDAYLYASQEKLEDESKSIYIGPVPMWPYNVVGRDHDKGALSAILFDMHGGYGNKICIHGAPGIGKSTFLSDFFYSPKLPEFYDGILWASLGTKPKTTKILNEWSKALGTENPSIKSHSELRNEIQAKIANRKMLIIIDDVWNSSDLINFMFGGNYCTLLFSTRRPKIPNEVAVPTDNQVLLNPLDDNSSIQLLKILAQKTFEHYPSKIKELAVRLEGHPLSLKVAARTLETQFLVNDNLDKIFNELLDPANILSQDIPFGYQGLPENQRQIVLSVFDKSLRNMSEEQKFNFALLGNLSATSTFDRNSLQWLWGESDVDKTLQEFIERGLIEPLGRSHPNQFKIHALIKGYAKWLQKELN